MAKSQSTCGIQGVSAPTLWLRERWETRPLVSICIPTYNRADYAEAAVRSALSQTYEPIEVLVSDDCSDDGSYERLLSVRDPRLHVKRNSHRRGPVSNRNAALNRVRGQLIKFLDDDDLLEPDCVSSMVSLFEQDPQVGMVFCPRTIIVEGDTDDDSVQAWRQVYNALHTQFGSLESVNDGRDLFRQLMTDGFRRNWIGEPTVVMVSTSHLRRTGAFSAQVQQLVDLDLWVRILPHCRVGFVSEELAHYRIGHRSVSKHNRLTKRAWLDRLWLLENLSRDPELCVAFPAISEMLHAERRQAWRTALKVGRGAGGRRVPAASYLPYARYRVCLRLGVSSSTVPERRVATSGN